METDLAYIKEELSKLGYDMLVETERKAEVLNRLNDNQVSSAKNLIHYLVLRNKDRRELQQKLHNHGLSSLSNSESHIYHQVQAIGQRLGLEHTFSASDTFSYEESKKILSINSRILFGKQKKPNTPYLMVTLDANIAENINSIKDLLQNGMNVARINCAHGNQESWEFIIKNLKEACAETKATCKIYMDLAGPKIRTKFFIKSKKRKIKIKEGQLIYLSEDRVGFKEEDIVISPNEKGIIPFLKVNQRVFIGDGKFCGIIESKSKHCIAVRIKTIFSKKSIIKEGKGINFPDSKIAIPALTDSDKSMIPFIVRNADLIGYSFVNKAEDIRKLMHEMTLYAARPPFIILKIETLSAVQNLPSLLLEGMRHSNFGVMIARGDLALELGFERMGEIQDEILWICEAANTPVIWATQVLENLHKSGTATRSEITDAGHAAMAECILINKGPHTVQVIKTLKDIIQRASSHRIKKRFTLRALKIASGFLR